MHAGGEWPFALAAWFDTGLNVADDNAHADTETGDLAMNAKQHEALLDVLKQRFDKHPARHEGVAWREVAARLATMPKKLDALAGMERTGGEPDVVGRDAGSGECLFVDCAAESPVGRRSLCFDAAALDARKENKPAGAALDMAAAIGVTLLDESQYRHLQTLGRFDTKTSSWIATPPAIRKLGGALFGDCRYDHVFVYHNGAQSYYAARGFRGLLRV